MLKKSNLLFILMFTVLLSCRGEEAKQAINTNKTEINNTESGTEEENTSSIDINIEKDIKDKDSTELTNTINKSFISQLQRILNNKLYDQANDLIGQKIKSGFDELEGFRIGTALFDDNFEVIGAVISYETQNEFIIFLFEEVDNEYDKIIDVYMTPRLNENEKLVATSGEIDGEYLDDILIITEDDLFGETIETFRYICKFDSVEGTIVDITDQPVIIYLEDG